MIEVYEEEDKKEKVTYLKLKPVAGGAVALIAVDKTGHHLYYIARISDAGMCLETDIGPEVTFALTEEWAIKLVEDD